MKRILTGIFFFLLSAAGSAAAEPVRLVLQWQHQSQFAGYYMALEKGFYRAENLDVTLIPGGAHVDPLRMIRDGQADFCTTMLSSVLGRHDRNEFVLLQQVLNRSNLTLVAWKKGRHGIDSIAAPSDLDQRRITLWDGFRPPYEAFFRRYGIDPVIIPQYYSFSLFLHRGADACCAMRYNEYHSLIQHGLRDEELTVFDFHELGVDLACLAREHPLGDEKLSSHRPPLRTHAAENEDRLSRLIRHGAGGGAARTRGEFGQLADEVGGIGVGKRDTCRVMCTS